MVFHVDDAVYDRFMGRYAAELAPRFADFARIGTAERVLDVGAGTGALTAELVDRVGASRVAAAEPSAEFTAGLRRRMPELEIRQAPAEDMPWADGSFDAVLAQLVISFVADGTAATGEMARLARLGGVVALCMWDEDGLDLAPPLRAARQVVAPADTPPPALPHRSEAALRRLLTEAGLRQVETATLTVRSEYASFEEYWDAARAMRGPDSAWMVDLDERRLTPGREAARAALGSPAGAFVLEGRAAAARGVRAS